LDGNSAGFVLKCDQSEVRDIYRFELPDGQWSTQDQTGLGPDINNRRFIGNDALNGVDPSGLEASAGLGAFGSLLPYLFPPNPPVWEDIVEWKGPEPVFVAGTPFRALHDVSSVTKFPFPRTQGQTETKFVDKVELSIDLRQFLATGKVQADQRIPIGISGFSAKLGVIDQNSLETAANNIAKGLQTDLKTSLDNGKQWKFSDFESSLLKHTENAGLTLIGEVKVPDIAAKPLILLGILPEPKSNNSSNAGNSFAYPSGIAPSGSGSTGLTVVQQGPSSFVPNVSVKTGFGISTSGKPNASLNQTLKWDSIDLSLIESYSYRQAGGTTTASGLPNQGGTGVGLIFTWTPGRKSRN
jgi:hypothetical protein